MSGIYIYDICKLMEEWAPLKLAYPNDNVGLVLGSSNWKLNKVLICLTITDTIVEEAIRQKVNLIISHHPIIHTPLYKIIWEHPYQKRIVQLIQNNIACYVCHTNLDVANKGLNYVLAQKLNLINTRGLLPVEHASIFKLVTFVPKTHLEIVREAVCSHGAGVIGEYAYCSFSTSGTGTFLPSDKANPFIGKVGSINEEAEERFEVIVPTEHLNNVIEALLDAHPYEEVAYDIYPVHNQNPKISLGIVGDLETPTTLEIFSTFVKNQLGLNSVRIVGNPNKEIKKVAVIGGSGGSEIQKIRENIDVLVTGDVKYHQALETLDKKIAIIDAGHFGTEYPIVQAIKEYLNKRLPLLETIITNETDPFLIK